MLSGPGLDLPAVQHVVEHLQEQSDIERLREIPGRPSSEQPVHLAVGGVGADDDHRDVSGLGVMSEAVQNLLSGNIWQVEVEQDHVRMMLSGQIDLDVIDEVGIGCRPEFA
jgi:hypothetical protein